MRIEDLTKLQQRLMKNRNIMQFEGSKFRRIVYPLSVEICTRNCNAGDDCCHEYKVEGIKFCIDYGIDQYGGNTNYILEKKVGKRWVKVEDKEETRKEGRPVGSW